MRQLRFFSHERRETEAFARMYAKQLRAGSVIALVGELGSGKTTFVQAFARELGVRRRVTSPTFVFMRIYNVRSRRSNVERFVHVDAYRARSADELAAIGLAEYLHRPDTVTIIEWADRIKTMIPKSATRISFQYGEQPNERRITIQRLGKLRQRR